VKHSSIQAAAKAKILQLVDNHMSLVEAFCVALALHVVFFPVMWIAGWALPWPKVPIYTTIIEYDLRGWTGWPKMINRMPLVKSTDGPTIGGLPI
jgi:hypothetical protein